MSNKEKDADDEENIILSVTVRRDENEKPVVEEERAVPRVPGLYSLSSGVVIFPHSLPYPRSDVVSVTDAIGRGGSSLCVRQTQPVVAP